MALKNVTGIDVYGSVPAGAPVVARTELTGNDAQILVDPIKRMTEIVETTGVGVERRQRRDARLQDLGGITISGLLDPAVSTGLHRMLKSAYTAGAPLTLEIAYGGAAGGADETVSANWLVSELEMSQAVGQFVMTKGTLEAQGTATFGANI